jgi:hypothetical protein
MAFQWTKSSINMNKNCIPMGRSTEIHYKYLSMGISMGTASKKCDFPLPCLNSRK